MRISGVGTQLFVFHIYYFFELSFVVLKGGALFSSSLVLSAPLILRMRSNEERDASLLLSFFVWGVMRRDMTKKTEKTEFAVNLLSFVFIYDYILWLEISIQWSFIVSIVFKIKLSISSEHSINAKTFIRSSLEKIWFRDDLTASIFRYSYYIRFLFNCALQS